PDNSTRTGTFIDLSRSDALLALLSDIPRLQLTDSVAEIEK
ncbi:MAG: hypothetical protein ACI8T1_005103, partial [Verrucomicrobiales bacterium]